jgi:hypothetical protein
MTRTDLECIVGRVHPAADLRMIEYNARVHHITGVERSVGVVGAPWEFNLRDVFR